MADRGQPDPSLIARLAHPGVATAIFISVAITLIAVTTPLIHFAYRNPPLHVAFETAEALIASFAAFLFYGRYKQSRRASDLGLVFVLDLLALTNIVFSVIPIIVLQGRPDIRHGWAPAVLRVAAGAVLLACARRDSGHHSLSPQPALVPFAAAAGCVATLGVLSLGFARYLPDPLDAVVITQTVDMLLAGHPVFMFVQGVSMTLGALAAVGFATRANEQKDELLYWVAAACVFWAFARLNFLLFPSLYTEYVYAGDLLRFGFYAMLLGGGVREIRSYWASRADAAVAEERRRFARDLHDGAAQELLFILAQTRRLRAGKGGPDDLEALESAADRAVFESRRAVNALSSAAEQPLTKALAEACEELGRRWGNAIDCDLEDVEVKSDVTEQLVRITREAITNAIKHASPSSIRVNLHSEPRYESRALVLVIEDDGIGFDARQTKQSSRFGISSIRERVAILGGELVISSRIGDGTRITATIEIPALFHP